jgi:hypothetical protein
MNKLEFIDDIIKKHGSPLQYVDDNPDYDVPIGLPNINLELRTERTVELYVLIDVNTSEDVIKDVNEAYSALRHAATKVSEKGGRAIRQWIELYNASEEQLDKYSPLIVRLLEKKILESPQLQQSVDTPLYSKAKQLYRQMDKPVLN